MNIRIDAQFTRNLQILVEEILIDEAKFIEKKDQTLAPLHEVIFSANQQTPFINLKPEKQLFFRKYFYLDGNINTPRPLRPFSNSFKDQAFFFDQLHQQLRFCTYNFQRLDRLRPGFAEGEKDQGLPVFDVFQKELLVNGLVKPLLHSVEQREIALLESGRKKTGPTSTEPVNPYQGLGEQILVRGISGEFDVVLSHAELAELAGQEAEFRKEGLEGEQLAAMLREYVSRRFPGLAVALSATGHVETLISPEALDDQIIRLDNSAPESTSAPTDISFTQILPSLNQRQARQLQYATLAASNYNLSLPAGGFQVAGDGFSATLSGSGVRLDKSGQGSNAVLFVLDSQGVAARLEIDVDKYRLKDGAIMHFSIYQKPDQDSPANPKLKLAPEDMAQLRTPLLALYKKLQEAKEYQVNSHQRLQQRPATGPIPPLDFPASDSSSSRNTAKNPAGAATYAIPFTKSPGDSSTLPLIPTPRTVAAPLLSSAPRRVMPKISASQPAQLTASASSMSQQPAMTATQAAGRAPVPGISVAANQPPQPKNYRAAIVAVATGLPLLATFSAAAINSLT